MAQSMPSDYIQILTYIARKPSLTREQFYHYWETVHGPKVAPWAEKHGIKQYQQVPNAPFPILQPHDNILHSDPCLRNHHSQPIILISAKRFT